MGSCLFVSDRALITGDRSLNYDICLNNAPLLDKKMPVLCHQTRFRHLIDPFDTDPLINKSEHASSFASMLKILILSIVGLNYRMHGVSQALALF